MTTLQKTIIGAALAASIGTGIFEAYQASQLRSQLQTLQQQQATLTEQNHQLQRERDDASKRLAGLLAENEQWQSGKMRGEPTRLDGGTNDTTAVAANRWLERVNKLKQWVGQHSAATIPEFQFLSEGDWLNATRGDLKTDNDFRRTMSSLREVAINRFLNQLQPALQKYLQANNGQFPTDLNQLQSYFDAPVDDAILQRWEIVPVSTVAGKSFGDLLGDPSIITEKTAVDDLLDTRYVVGQTRETNYDWLDSELRETLQPVYDAFAQANPNENRSKDPSQYLPYATTPEQQAAVQKLIERQQLQAGR